MSGDGSGHASRTREIASHLIEAGNEVKLVSYGRGYSNLKDEFDVFETEGLQIVSRDNKVSMTRTVSKFEQELNAFQLERAGYGLTLRDMQPHEIGNFLYLLPEFEKNLGQYKADDNSAIKTNLDSLVADHCAVARLYHERREANSKRVTSS